MKHGLVALVVMMILEDTATFQVLFIVSPFFAWNTTTVEIAMTLVKSAKCLFNSGGLGLCLVSKVGLGLVILVLVLV